MTNIATAIKQEIIRLARKEVRSETDALKKQAAKYRGEIAALKRRLDAVERQGKRVAKTVARTEPQEVTGESVTKLRFRAEGLASHRKRLGLSAREAAQLLGVSQLTVFKWEKGQTHPRASQIPAIAAFRKLGRRAAVRQLAAN